MQTDSTVPETPPAARGNLILLSGACIWGIGFAFMRQASEFIAPLPFSGIRFLLGGLALLPLALWRRRAAGGRNPGSWLAAGTLSGVFLFLASPCQQYAFTYTTTAKGGFIGSLYVVLTPLFMLLLGRKAGPGEWIGGLLSVAGLYFLSECELSLFNKGDAAMLVAAALWSAQIIVLGIYAPAADVWLIACLQSLVCGGLSIAASLAAGDFPTASQAAPALGAIIYCSLGSVAMGNTLQVIGQKYAGPAAACMVMQMMAVVAAVSGWALLGETMSGRMLFGAGLMLLGMTACQSWDALAAARRRHFTNPWARK